MELCVVAAIAPRRGLRRRRATTSLDSSARRSRRGAEDGRSRRAGASLSSARRTNAERRRRRRALPTPLARRCGASPRALAPVCRGVVAREIPAFFFRLGDRATCHRSACLFFPDRSAVDPRTRTRDCLRVRTSRGVLEHVKKSRAGRQLAPLVVLMMRRAFPRSREAIARARCIPHARTHVPPFITMAAFAATTPSLKVRLDSSPSRTSRAARRVARARIRRVVSGVVTHSLRDRASSSIRSTSATRVGCGARARAATRARPAPRRERDLTRLPHPPSLSPGRVPRFHRGPQARRYRQGACSSESFPPRRSLARGGFPATPSSARTTRRVARERPLTRHPPSRRVRRPPPSTPPPRRRLRSRSRSTVSAASVRPRPRSGTRAAARREKKKNHLVSSCRRRSIYRSVDCRRRDETAFHTTPFAW